MNEREQGIGCVLLIVFLIVVLFGFSLVKQKSHIEDLQRRVGELEQSR